MVCQTGEPIENHLKSGLRSKLRQMVGPTDGTMKPFIDNLTKRDRDKNQKKNGNSTFTRVRGGTAKTGTLKTDD